MSYDTGAHTVFYHRYHIVWITKYRFKVLTGELRLKVHLRADCRHWVPKVSFRAESRRCPRGR